MKNLPKKIFNMLLICGILLFGIANNHCTGTLQNISHIKNKFSIAETLEKKADFWSACSLFFKIFKTSKDDEEIQVAGLHLGNCFDSLYLFGDAKDVYNTLIDKFPESPYLAWYHIGIMDIDCKLEYYDSVHIRYNNCLEQGLKLPLISKLINGESFYDQEKYSDALRLFIEIDSGSDLFCKAQSYTGLSYLKSGDTVVAFEILKHVFAECSSCVDEVALALGYLNFDKDNSMTLVNLNGVPDTSFFADEALILRIWYSLKEKNLRNVDSLTCLFQKKYQKSPYWCESWELKAYGLAMQQKHCEAQKIRNFCTDMLMSRWPNDSVNNQILRDSLLLMLRKNDMLFFNTIPCKNLSDKQKYMLRNAFKNLQQKKADAGKFHRYSPRKNEFFEPFDCGCSSNVQKTGISKSEKIDDELEKLKRELEKQE